MDLVAEMRGFETDHEPEGWPAVRMRQISALCDEIERLRTGDTCGRQCEGTAYRIEARRLLIRNEMLEQGAQRYELLRTLSAHEFAELYRANISGAGMFDDLVDEKVRARLALKTPNA